jgi:putative holliday junction resolvase
MKYLGIDYGEAKVGLALGDDETKIALPYKILTNTGWEKLFDDLRDVIKVENIKTIIIGLPVNLKSEKTPQTEKVKKFIDRLNIELDCEVIPFDERLSSVEAQKLRAGKRDDDIAAMLILQNYFDSNL